ncbi:hypothetical protein [Streptomyces sp. NPDC091219]|uniref:hypothetical protein n=1 Tax=Streptomyces sp. NPDC091219 TaxID=3155193 RepID=UPI00344B74C6
MGARGGALGAGALHRQAEKGMDGRPTGRERGGRRGDWGAGNTPDEVLNALVEKGDAVGQAVRHQA